MNSKPSLVMNPSRPTSPSSSWLFAIVVPWLTETTASIPWPSRASIFSRPVMKPCAGSAGVDGVLVTVSSPVASSKATTSVKVPPVSMPMRMCGAVMASAGTPAEQARHGHAGQRGCGACYGAFQEAREVDAYHPSARELAVVRWQFRGHARGASHRHRHGGRYACGSPHWHVLWRRCSLSRRFAGHEQLVQRGEEVAGQLLDGAGEKALADSRDHAVGHGVRGVGDFGAAVPARDEHH